jgi:hypothetical protein
MLLCLRWWAYSWLSSRSSTQRSLYHPLLLHLFWISFAAISENRQSTSLCDPWASQSRFARSVTFETIRLLYLQHHKLYWDLRSIFIACSYPVSYFEIDCSF